MRNDEAVSGGGKDPRDRSRREAEQRYLNYAFERHHVSGLTRYPRWPQTQ
jgi:hypothetical protein